MSIKSEKTAYLRIKRKVILNDFAPGEQISITALQNDLLVSHLPIREALIALSAEDLVDFVPGKGFFAKPSDVPDLLGNIDLLRYLMADAGLYISAVPTIQIHLRRELDVIRKTSTHSERDFLETLHEFVQLLQRHYRRPHADVAGRCLYRCYRVLIADAHLSGWNLFANGIVYFWLLSVADQRRLERRLDGFWAGVKGRLAQTLIVADLGASTATPSY